MTEISTPRPARERPARVRGAIFGSGALVGIAIAIAALVVLSPMTRARSHLRELADKGVPLQSQLVDLRTSVADWQFFIEPHYDSLAPGMVSDPTELVKGAQIAARQSAQEKTLARGLRSIGYAQDARDLDVAMTKFSETLAPLSPVAAGSSVSPAALRTLINDERVAALDLWDLTTRVGTHLSQGFTGRAVQQATDHLVYGRWLFLIAAALDLLLVLGAALFFGLRAGRDADARSREMLRHDYEAQLQRALEMTKNEADVYGIIGDALSESLPKLKIEMLIADSSRAHFQRALTNDGDFEGCAVVSPLDCPAATGGQTLTFSSSRALDACPHLKDRPAGACSAGCIPVSIAGRAMGVTHVVGPDGSLPSPVQIEAINFTSRRGSERIAMIRAFETSETQAHTDPLTGLLNRRSLENRVRDLQRDGTPYSLAYGDLDRFKTINDTHGHDAGDRALRAFARVLRDAVRPNDIVARYGGEEFVIVLPDCDTGVAVGVLERVRENLALALAAGHVPAFTVTFGVASTEYANGFAEVVAFADQALLDAKEAGRNRVGVAPFPAAAANT